MTTPFFTAPLAGCEDCHDSKLQPNEQFEQQFGHPETYFMMPLVMVNKVPSELPGGHRISRDYLCPPAISFIGNVLTIDGVSTTLAMPASLTYNVVSSNETVSVTPIVAGGLTTFDLSVTPFDLCSTLQTLTAGTTTSLLPTDKFLVARGQGCAAVTAAETFIDTLFKNTSLSYDALTGVLSIGQEDEQGNPLPVITVDLGPVVVPPLIMEIQDADGNVLTPIDYNAATHTYKVKLPVTSLCPPVGVLPAQLCYGAELTVIGPDCKPLAAKLPCLPKSDFNEVDLGTTCVPYADFTVAGGAGTTTDLAVLNQETLNQRTANAIDRGVGIGIFADPYITDTSLAVQAGDTILVAFSWADSGPSIYYFHSLESTIVVTPGGTAGLSAGVSLGKQRFLKVNDVINNDWLQSTGEVYKYTVTSPGVVNFSVDWAYSTTGNPGAPMGINATMSVHRSSTATPVVIDRVTMFSPHGGIPASGSETVTLGVPGSALIGEKVVWIGTGRHGQVAAWQGLGGNVLLQQPGTTANCWLEHFHAVDTQPTYTVTRAANSGYSSLHTQPAVYWAVEYSKSAVGTPSSSAYQFDSVSLSLTNNNQCCGIEEEVEYLHTNAWVTLDVPPNSSGSFSLNVDGILYPVSLSKPATFPMPSFSGSKGVLTPGQVSAAVTVSASIEFDSDITDASGAVCLTGGRLSLKGLI
jgi:hypothetical protein